MVDAFFYMFVVGAGTSSGVAAVAFISWKVVERSKRKQGKRGKLNGVIK